jgi:hypothetical protein
MKAGEYLEQTNLKPVPPEEHSRLIEEMTVIGMPTDLIPFIKSDVLDFLLHDIDDSLAFTLPRHTKECEMITLTWYHPSHRPEADILYQVFHQVFADKECTKPLRTDILDLTTIEQLIDYLETEPE